MELTLGGLSKITKIPDVIFVSAMQREKTAVTEANRTGVEIVGICDTNANPIKADFIIPANDDAVNSITMMVDLVSDAVKAGKAMAEKRKQLS